MKLSQIITDGVCYEKAPYHDGVYGEQLTSSIKNIREYSKSYQYSCYLDFFKGYSREKRGQYLQFADAYLELKRFPKVFYMEGIGVTILAKPLQCLEGVLRSCWGMAYCELGFASYNAETQSERTEIIDILQNPYINTLGREYLIILNEKGYLRNLSCISAESLDDLNSILRELGLTAVD